MRPSGTAAVKAELLPYFIIIFKADLNSDIAGNAVITPRMPHPQDIFLSKV